MHLCHTHWSWRYKLNFLDFDKNWVLFSYLYLMWYNCHLCHIYQLLDLMFHTTRQNPFWDFHIQEAKIKGRILRSKNHGAIICFKIFFLLTWRLTINGGLWFLIEPIDPCVLNDRICSNSLWLSRVNVSLKIFSRKNNQVMVFITHIWLRFEIRP